MLTSNREKIKKLRKRINKYNYYYHSLGISLVDDAEYDVLYNKLLKMEKDFPRLVEEKSPTKYIGYPMKSKNLNVFHKIPMLSLENAFTKKDIKNFINRIKNKIKYTGKKMIFCCEPKIDGLAVNLQYKNGILTKASTRGNGKIGEDITNNIRTINSIPLKLQNSIPNIFEVRGEIYISVKEFQKLNKKLQKKGKKPFSTPRNAAVSSIRNSNIEMIKKRKLCFIAYGYGETNKEWENLSINTQSSLLKFLKRKNFSIFKNYLVVSSIEECIDYYNYIFHNQANIPYKMDGVVFKVESLSLQKKLGYTSRSPCWAIAYKFPGKEAQTEIMNIKFQIGRSGNITPIANLKEIYIGGVKIKNVNLHNFYEIKKKNLCIGDKVIIQHSGDVIPKLLRKVFSESSSTKPIIFPKYCPSCERELDQSSQIARCLNGWKCTEQRIKRIEHFVSRNAINIQGLGKKIISQLVKKKLIYYPIDIYYLINKKEKLEKLKGIGEKTIFNLFSSIELSKKNNLSSFIYALGIPNVGKSVSNILGKKYKNIQEIQCESIKSLQDKCKISLHTSTCIHNFFSNIDNQSYIKNFHKIGIH